MAENKHVAKLILRFNRFDIQKVSQQEIEAIRNPVLLIYQMASPKDGERENLESNIKTRLELGLKTADYFPLPSYFCEQRVLLGSRTPLYLSSYLCSHKKLQVGYYDIYEQKKYRKLLYEDEKKMIANKKTLRPERDLIVPSSGYFNRVLLGTTMIPKPIFDYIVDQVMNLVHI